MHSARHDLHIEPSPGASGADWRDLALRQPTGELFGHAQSTWHEKTRCELGLATDRPIIATGHQTLLWHPGILARYLIVDRIAQQHGFATANLIVDQHVGPYGQFDVPILRNDGSLQERTINLVTDGADPARLNVPMGLQSAFTPSDPPLHLPFALDSVHEGVARIFERVAAHCDAPNAAHQMARALGDLMNRWVRPMPPVTASDLGDTSLARQLMQAMVDSPRAMAQAYNAAVRAVPEAGIPPLLVHDLYVEVPLWRIRADGRRMRAYDNDIEMMFGAVHTSPLPCREGDRGWVTPSESTNAQAHTKHAPTPQPPPSREGVILLPRALFMTALVRLGMCDLYIHGTGGGTYDRAMELWIRNWLSVDVAPKAVVSATLHLPLSTDNPTDVEAAIHEYRRTWHDPERQTSNANNADGISRIKRRFLERINQLPHRSPERKAAFFKMHEELQRLRHQHRPQIEQARERYETAQRRRADGRIAARRDWPFPLYSDEAIKSLAEVIDDRLTMRVSAR